MPIVVQASLIWQMRLIHHGRIVSLWALYDWMVDLRDTLPDSGLYRNVRDCLSCAANLRHTNEQNEITHESSGLLRWEILFHKSSAFQPCEAGSKSYVNPIQRNWSFLSLYLTHLHRARKPSQVIGFVSWTRPRFFVFDPRWCCQLGHWGS
jgi:hypothetical protein